jgi:hypothetical protein
VAQLAVLALVPYLAGCLVSNESLSFGRVAARHTA